MSTPPTSEEVPPNSSPNYTVEISNKLRVADELQRVAFRHEPSYQGLRRAIARLATEPYASEDLGKGVRWVSVGWWYLVFRIDDSPRRVLVGGILDALDLDDASLLFVN